MKIQFVFVIVLLAICYLPCQSQIYQQQKRQLSQKQLRKQYPDQYKQQKQQKYRPLQQLFQRNQLNLNFPKVESSFNLDNVRRTTEQTLQKIGVFKSTAQKSQYFDALFDSAGRIYSTILKARSNRNYGYYRQQIVNQAKILLKKIEQSLNLLRSLPGVVQNSQYFGINNNIRRLPQPGGFILGAGNNNNVEGDLILAAGDNNNFFGENLLLYTSNSNINGNNNAVFAESSLNFSGSNTIVIGPAYIDIQRMESGQKFIRYAPNQDHSFKPFQG